MNSFHVHQQFDREAWDSFVSSQASGHFMQSYGWGQLQLELGWDVEYCVFGETDIRATALVLSRRIPSTGMTVFYTPRGPTIDLTNQRLTSDFFTELKEHFSRRRGVFLRSDPYWPEPSESDGNLSLADLRHVPRDWSSWNAPRFVFWLDLQRALDDVFKGMSSGCRNEVRRGYKNSVDFCLGGAHDLEDFHQLMVATGQHKGIAFRDADYYRLLFDTVGESGDVQLFLGRFEDNVISAGVSVAYGDKAWLLYAASSPDHYKLRANRATQWEMIKWAHERGCHRYDFRGTATNDPPRPEDPGYGVYRFKKGFGPTFTRLIGYYDLVQRPLAYRALRSAEDYGLPIAYRLRTWLQR